MTQELGRLLSELELEQLKDLAKRYEIDCSGCERKEEYIISISQSQKVRAEDLQSLYRANPGNDPKPEDKSMQAFTEAEQLLQETKNVFNSGDYITTIDKATAAIDAGAKALNAFYGIGLSYAIRSSENMISNLRSVDVDASSVEQILERVRQSYENQEYRSARNIIVELKDAMSQLYQQQTQKITGLIEATQSLINDAKGVGTDVSEAEKRLQDARDMLAVNSLPNALHNIKESESLVKGAQQNKVQEVSNMISKASAVIEEARYLNAPVSEAESHLEAAKNAFDSEDYASAIENANKASEAANTARNGQIQRALSIQEKMRAAPSEVAEAQVPIITEPGEALEAEEEFTIEMEEEAEAIVEPKPTEVAKVCPKCGGEPTYVEQYQRYYCYSCSEYVEPVEKAIEERAEAVLEPKPTEVTKTCPKCGGEPTYVEQYQRYYCYTCSEYVEPLEKAKERKVEAVAKPKPTVVVKVCPKCGGEPTYVEQYQRYYCYTCSEYVEPVEKAKERKVEAVAKPKPTIVTKVCPKCGGEPTYVEQYQRYYCYTCSEYVEPVEKAKERKVEAVAKPKPTVVVKVCPKCGGEPTYVEQYQRYYCYICSEYVEPVEKVKERKVEAEAKPKPTKAKVCPNCGGEPTYVEQYRRYYCYTCNAYVEPIEKKPSTTCPTCGGEPTFVEQYQRYYCYTCNRYL